MKDYQKRVIEEMEQLGLKIAKLRPFTKAPEFAELDHDNQVLLVQQLDVMVDYYHILCQRIDLFDKE